MQEFFGLKGAGKVSCDPAQQPNSEPETGYAKGQIREHVQAYYERCLKPHYRRGHFERDTEGNSESLSYALLQSYYAGDRKTFDKVWQWTKKFIQHDDDHLFAWQFAYEYSFWSFPIKTVRISDYNSATDADTDIAYALFLAGEAWGRRDYVLDAKNIVNDIWDKETVEAGGKRFVLAGNWANLPEGLVVNPSYFAPQAYREFAKYDLIHDWNKVITDGYALLSQVSSLETRRGLPPNWVIVSKTDGAANVYTSKQDSQDYSYDAFRVFYRVALDQKTTPSFEAFEYLSARKIFEDEFRNSGQLCSLYIHEDGNLRCDHNTTGLAGPLGVFSVTSEYFADQLIRKYYIHDRKLQFPDYSFYAHSWHWFGLELWSR